MSALANRLTSYAAASTSTYAYNANGLRMSKTSGGTTTQFVWDVSGGLPLLLRDGATTYVYGPAGLPLEQLSGSTTYYFHHDQLGSTRLVTDLSGTAQASYTFDSYGNLVASTGSITNPIRFAAQYQDSESGLYYIRARYYDPITGQFVSLDPAVETTRQPYDYVSGNPLNTRDPSGLATVGFCYGGLISFALSFIGTNCLTFATHNSVVHDVTTLGSCGAGNVGSCVNYAKSVTGIGLVPTLGGGGGSPSASVFGSVQVSNANYLHELTGPFGYAGASATVGPDAGIAVGVEGAAGLGDCGRSIYVGGISVGPTVDFPLPFEFHGGISNTWEWKWWGEQ